MPHCSCLRDGSCLLPPSPRLDASAPGGQTGLPGGGAAAGGAWSRPQSQEQTWPGRPKMERRGSSLEASPGGPRCTEVRLPGTRPKARANGRRWRLSCAPLLGPTGRLVASSGEGVVPHKTLLSWSSRRPRPMTKSANSISIARCHYVNDPWRYDMDHMGEHL